MKKTWRGVKFDTDTMMLVMEWEHNPNNTKLLFTPFVLMKLYHEKTLDLYAMIVTDLNGKMELIPLLRYWLDMLSHWNKQERTRWVNDTIAEEVVHLAKMYDGTRSPTNRKYYKDCY